MVANFESVMVHFGDLLPREVSSLFVRKVNPSVMKKVAPNPYFFRNRRATVYWLAFESSKVSTTSLSGTGSSCAPANASGRVETIPAAHRRNFDMMTFIDAPPQRAPAQRVPGPVLPWRPRRNSFLGAMRAISRLLPDHSHTQLCVPCIVRGRDRRRRSSSRCSAAGVPKFVVLRRLKASARNSISARRR